MVHSIKYGAALSMVQVFVCLAKHVLLHCYDVYKVLELVRPCWIPMASAYTAKMPILGSVTV